MKSNARYLPKPKPRRQPAGSLPAEHCPKCKRLLDESKYHDCGEQIELFPVDPAWRRPKRRRGAS